MIKTKPNIERAKRLVAQAEVQGLQEAHWRGEQAPVAFWSKEQGFLGDGEYSGAFGVLVLNFGSGWKTTIPCWEVGRI